MEKCVYCGTDTMLRVNGVPICVKCDAIREAGGKPPQREDPPPKGDKALVS